MNSTFYQIFFQTLIEFCQSFLSHRELYSWLQLKFKETLFLLNLRSQLSTLFLIDLFYRFQLLSFCILFYNLLVWCYKMKCMLSIFNTTQEFILFLFIFAIWRYDGAMNNGSDCEGSVDSSSNSSQVHYLFLARKWI